MLKNMSNCHEFILGQDYKSVFSTPVPLDIEHTLIIYPILMSTLKYTFYPIFKI